MHSAQLQSLLTLAGKAAKIAGNYIANINHDEITVNYKAGGSTLASQVVTQVDIDCEKLIYSAFKDSCTQFNIAFLGEESADSFAINQHPRLSKPYFWCVDPLDGTLAFTENVPGYAVAIALVNQQGQALLGAVYNPRTDELYQAIANQPQLAIKQKLFKNQQPWQPLLPSPLKTNTQETTPALSVFFDRSFQNFFYYPKLIKELEQRALALGYSGINIENQAGSVINAIQVLENAPACYFKLPKKERGGGSIWDFAATSALANAASIWVSDIYGKPLNLNSAESLFMNKSGVIFAHGDQLASDTELAKIIMEIAEHFNPL